MAKNKNERRKYKNKKRVKPVITTNKLGLPSFCCGGKTLRQMYLECK